MCGEKTMRLMPASLYLPIIDEKLHLLILLSSTFGSRWVCMSMIVI